MWILARAWFTSYKTVLMNFSEIEEYPTSIANQTMQFKLLYTDLFPQLHALQILLFCRKNLFLTRTIIIALHFINNIKSIHLIFSSEQPLPSTPLFTPPTPTQSFVAARLRVNMQIHQSNYIFTVKYAGKWVIVMIKYTI